MDIDGTTQRSAVEAGRRVVESAAAPGGSWPGELTAILVHGAMDRGAGMARVTRELPDAPTVRYDRRGYGHARALVSGTLAEHVDDLCTIAGDRAVVVFGHSFGGLVALAAAASERIDIRALTLYETPTPWAPWWPKWPGPLGEAGSRRADPQIAGDTAEAFLRSLISDARWERLPERTRNARRAEGPALLADVSAETSRAMPFDAARVLVPAVVAYGTSSTPQYRQAAELLGAALRRSELHQIEGADHGAPFTRAAEVARLIRRSASLASLA